MAAPKDNKGSKSDKLITDALRVAMQREAKLDGKPSKRLYVMADKVAIAAMNCEQWAVKEVWDRLEGKPHQAIEHSGTIEHENVTDTLAEVLSRLDGMSGRIPQEDKGDKESVH